VTLLDGVDTHDAAPPVCAGPPARRHDRWALGAFVAISVAAVPILLWLTEDRWFQYDEFDFLASRDGGDIGDLLEPHVVHWSTLPIVAYRGMWHVVGLDAYWPYQLMAVLSHLGVAVLLRTVMRRAGVRPWTATAAALVVVFFGAGEENIGWAFQITWNASLVLGLAQLLMADHDGPVDRRDWFGVLAGLAGLLTSGVAVTMVVVVGLATLVRRGWRVAVFHTAPLGAAYLGWYVAYGRSGYESEGDVDPAAALRFCRSVVTATVDGLAQVPGAGWAVGALLLGGALVAVRGRPRSRVRAIAGAPAALAAGAFVFAAITAVGRADRGLESAGQTRYVYVVGTLLLPAIAVAADVVMRRWRAAVPVLMLVLAASLIGNLRDFSNGRAYAGDFLAGYRNTLLAMPRSPLADQVPRDVRPERGLAPNVSVGWLVDGVESGRLPPPGPMTPEARARTEGRLVLQAVPGHRPVECETAVGPVDVTLQRGSSLRAPGGQLWVTYTSRAGDVGVLPFPQRGRTVVASAGPLTVRASSTAPDGTVAVCDLDGGPVTVQGGP
jgi:hypothetical protein